jgi:hypothetical protein
MIMKTYCNWEDRDILLALNVYRHKVGDKHGPPNLETFSEYVAYVTGHDKGPSRSNLSARVRRLKDRGLVDGLETGRYGVYTSTLVVTKLGEEFLAVKSWPQNEN